MITTNRNYLDLLWICLSLIKAFFHAVTQVAWGLASLFILNGVFVYLHEKQNFDLTTISPLFIRLESFIITNIMFFVIVFFILISYLEVKEVYK